MFSRSSPSAPSTAPRLPTDLVGIVLSFLSQAEWWRAVQCARDWHRASCVASASPSVDVERVIQWHRHARNHDHRAQRTAGFVRCPTITLRDGPSERYLPGHHASAHKFLRAVHLQRDFHWDSATQNQRELGDLGALLRALASPALPHLELLSISSALISQGQAARLPHLLTSVAASGLQVLLAHGMKLPSELALLVQLRVLVCAEASSEGLLGLQRLEFLSISNFGAVRALEAIQQLQHHHALRGLAVAGARDIRGQQPARLSELVSYQGSPSNLTHVDVEFDTPEEWTQMFALLPALTSVTCKHWSGVAAAAEPDDAAQAALIWRRYAQLRALYAHVSNQGPSRSSVLLQRCVGLTRLHLEFYAQEVADCVSSFLPALPLLEHFICTRLMAEDPSIYLDSIRALATHCPRLRVLECSTLPGLWCDEAVSLLAGLGSFERWNFRWIFPDSLSRAERDRQPPLEFTESMLRSLARSRTWHAAQLSLDVTIPEWPLPNRKANQPQCFAADLDYLALRHFRFYYRILPTMRCTAYRIGAANTDGERAWIDHNDLLQQPMEGSGKNCVLQ